MFLSELFQLPSTLFFGHERVNREIQQSRNSDGYLSYLWERLTRSKKHRMPLFALIIGINDYANVRKLCGAVADADAMKWYLEANLKVPSNQIRNLRDRQATRSMIIQAFYELQNDSRIQHGDPILIFYAGHGAELPAPPSWEAGGVGSKIQCLVPQNYNPHRDEEIHGIPDRTIAALVEGIARVKGDNITVILDCCHSGSGTRKLGKMTLIRSVELTSAFPAELDRHIWEGVTRGTSTAAGFARSGLRSHVLLAACSQDEQALESGEQGHFTRALLLLLKRVGTDKLTYTDVLNLMDAIPSQNPQCEGYNQNRILFNGKLVSHIVVTYPVHVNESGQYIVDAGAAHGVSEGAEFVVYADDRPTISSVPLGVLVANDGDQILPFQTTLTPKAGEHFDLPNLSFALQTREGGMEDLLLFVQEELVPVLEPAIQQIRRTSARRITLVDREEARLAVVLEDGKVAFEILNPLLTAYGLTRMPFTLNPISDALCPILHAASHFHLHLNRSQPNNLIQNRIKVDFYRLRKSVANLDETGRPRIYAREPSLCVDNQVIDIVVDPNGIYGLKITNDTPWDLYPNVFFFDNSDLSIQAWYMPPTAGQFIVDVPLRRNGGSLTIGYGSGGSPPNEFFMRPGQDIDVAFLKLFFATSCVDMSKIPQKSPFEGSRGVPNVDKEQVDIWGTILIPVVQRRG